MLTDDEIQNIKKHSEWIDDQFYVPNFHFIEQKVSKYLLGKTAKTIKNNRK